MLKLQQDNLSEAVFYREPYEKKEQLIFFHKN